MAVPLILGLAAWGLDRLLKLNWPRIFINVSRAQTAKPLLGLNIAYAIIAVLLIGALNSAYDFNRAWLSTTKVSNPPLIQALKTPATQWVYPPFGQGFWLPFGFDANLKMVTVSRPWNWKDRPMPPYYLEATYDPVNRNSPNYLESIDGINLIVRPENQYALIETGGSCSTNDGVTLHW